MTPTNWRLQKPPCLDKALPGYRCRIDTEQITPIFEDLETAKQWLFARLQDADGWCVAEVTRDDTGHLVWRADTIDLQIFDNNFDRLLAT